MGVDRHDLRIGEEFANAGIGLSGLGKDCVRHHAVGIEAAERQHPFLEHGRDAIQIFGAALLGFGHEKSHARGDMGSQRRG